MPKAQRPADDRTASRTALVTKLTALRTLVTDVKANRASDQGANVGQLRARISKLEDTVAVLAAALLATAGVDTPTDRT